MRCVVQKVLKSSVSVDGKEISSIGKGLNVLVGFTEGDNIDTIKAMVKKIVNLRIFNSKPEQSVKDIDGEILSISQFTLYADTKKGNRPSYQGALESSKALPMYLKFNELLNLEVPTKGGIFGSDMKVSILNDGPETILLEI